MKKSLLKIAVCFVMVLTLVSGIGITSNSSVTYAYDRYLNGDTNYVLLYGHQGVSYYLDLSSVVAKQQDSVAHAFAQNVVTVADGNITDTKTYWYYQARNSDDDFEAFVSNDGKNWRRFKVNDFTGAMAVVVTGFRYGFAEAFGYGWS